MWVWKTPCWMAPEVLVQQPDGLNDPHSADILSNRFSISSKSIFPPSNRNYNVLPVTSTKQTSGLWALPQSADILWGLSLDRFFVLLNYLLFQPKSRFLISFRSSLHPPFQLRLQSRHMVLGRDHTPQISFQIDFQYPLDRLSTLLSSYDYKADIWSLGVTTLHRYPFKSIFNIL